MEYFDLYDEFGINLNKKIARGETTSPNEYHKVVHVWIKNDRDEYLVQQRNKSTDRNPYQWAPTAGAVISGEDTITAAIRETEEEIGVLLKQHELVFKDSLFIKHSKTNYIIDIFYINKNIILGGLQLEKSEVKAVAYMTKEKIFEMMENNQFWDFLSFKPKYDYFTILEKS
ncbi:MAG: NUDIX domain-containing protein [Tenericutes bacterium]|nr:NUDIX domain-containing protein [Mycoplasmatota bacterium]